MAALPPFVPYSSLCRKETRNKLLKTPLIFVERKSLLGRQNMSPSHTRMCVCALSKTSLKRFAQYRLVDTIREDGNKRLTQNWILANCKKNRNLQAPLTAQRRQPAMNLIMTTLKEVLEFWHVCFKIICFEKPTKQCCVANVCNLCIT